MCKIKHGEKFDQTILADRLALNYHRPYLPCEWCAQMSPASMPIYFLHAGGLKQNEERMEKFRSKISLSFINLFKKIPFSWNNGTRPLLFNGLMTSSGTFIINVVSRSRLSPPGCVEMWFAELDFIRCFFHLWKGQEAVSSRMCCLVSCVWSLQCLQNKISAHSARPLFAGTRGSLF